MADHDDTTNTDDAVTASLPASALSVPLPTPSSRQELLHQTLTQGPHWGHLNETSTCPLVWDTEITVLQLEQALRAFCERSDFLERGLPYIESFVWDEVRLMPHVHVHLRAPISGASLATVEGVRAELEQFAEGLTDLFRDHVFAVSAHLD